MPQLTPNYLTTDANGQVSANFDGHISAAGVDLVEGGDTLTPAADRRVAWHKDSLTGATIAEVFGAEGPVSGFGGTQDAAVLQARPRTGTSSTLAVLRALTDTGNPEAFVAAYRPPAPALSQIVIQADPSGNTRQILLGEDGSSSMVQRGVMTGGKHRLMISGPYSVAFNLTAGNATQTNVTVSTGVSLLASEVIPFAAINYAPPINWQDTVTWAYAIINATTMQIALHNYGSGTSIGTIYFYVIQGDL